MSSMFSFMQPGDTPPRLPPPSTPPLLPAPTSAPPDAARRAPGPNAHLNTLLNILTDYVTDLPSPSVLATSVAERPLAMGNWRGMERRGAFAMVALKGGRLTAEIAFQFLADTPDLVNDAVTTLQGRLLTARDDLWKAGVLQVTAGATTLADQLPTLNTWRKVAHFRVLYEYHFVDTDGAESIIARIPIQSAQEAVDSPGYETTTVTDVLVRWDDEQTPRLVLTANTGSRVRIGGMASLAYLPVGFTGNQVTVARLRRSATGAPNSYATLDAFWAAITDPGSPDRHAQVTFASVAQFLAQFSPAGDPLALGDWDQDGVPDLYQPSARVCTPPLVLNDRDDLFQISYQDTSFPAKAVVYLRAEAHQ